MKMLNTVVLWGAIAWVAWILLGMRQLLRRGGIVAPPMFASTLLFVLGVIAVLVMSVSPLHLLWWLPITFVLGMVALMFSPASTSR